NAVTQQVSTLLSGLKSPGAVTVDGLGDVYVADSGNNAVKIATPIYISMSSSRTEGPLAGTDSVPVLSLPANTPLKPTKDQSWITLTGSSGGAVSFSYTTNTSINSRVGNITVWGQQLTLTQNGDVPTTIIRNAGTGQSAPVGQLFPVNLQVRIKDAAGN